MRCQACLAALLISEFPPASGVCPSSSRATSRSARSTCAGGGRRGRTRRRVAPRAEGHPRPRAAAATGPATERGIPGGAEPLRRNAGSCRRHDRVIGVKNVGDSGIALSLGQRAKIVDRAHAPAVARGACAALRSARRVRPGGEVVRHLRRHDEPSEDELTDV